MADRRPSRGTGAPSSPGASRWKAAATWLIGGAAAIYAAAFTAAVCFSSTNPVLGLGIRPLVTPAVGNVADLALFTASEDAAKKIQAAARPGQGLPPSLISGIAITLAPEIRARVESLALMALRASPLANDALRQLAFLETAPARKRALLERAGEVSKRDVLATLQLAELRLRRNEIDEGLAGLDRALTVSEKVDSAVFPMLMGAVNTQADARRRVGKLLAGNRPWTERLVRWSIANPAALPGLSRIVGRIPAKSPARAIGYGQEMVDQLADQGQWAAAFGVYDSYSAKPQDLADVSRGALAPLDWRLLDDYDTGSRTIEGGLEVFASAGRGGQVAQIITRFKPGPRRLSLRIENSSPGSAELALNVECLRGSAVLPSSKAVLPLRNGVVAFPFSISSASCDFQRLSLGLTAGNEDAGAVITAISLGGDASASAR